METFCIDTIDQRSAVKQNDRPQHQKRSLGAWERAKIIETETETETGRCIII